MCNRNEIAPSESELQSLTVGYKVFTVDKEGSTTLISPFQHYNNDGNGNRASFKSIHKKDKDGFYKAITKKEDLKPSGFGESGFHVFRVLEDAKEMQKEWNTHGYYALVVKVETKGVIAIGTWQDSTYVKNALVGRAEQRNVIRCQKIKLLEIV